MDWTAVRNWPKALGAALALALLLSLVSFHLQDPTLTNLRLPSGGVGNWLGLPGALLGGSLLECLGTAALGAPLLLLNWSWCSRNRPPLHRYAAWGGLLLVTLAGLQGLVVQVGDPSLTGPGLAGWCVRYWVGLAGGPWLAALLLTGLAITAAARVLYAPLMHAAARDARVFAVWLLRRLWRGWGQGWAAVRRRGARMQRVAGAAGLGLSRRSGRGLRRVVRTAMHPPRVALAWAAELRAPSLAHIKLRSAARAASPAWARPEALEPDAPTDAFASWLSDEDGAHATRHGLQPLLPPEPGGAGAPNDAPHPGPTAQAPDGGNGSPRTGQENGSAPGDLAGLIALNQAEPASEPAPVPTEAGIRAPAAATKNRIPENEDTVPAGQGAATRPPPLDTGGYVFERPEAEAAWRERFQRYARNLDLDWEEQVWRQREQDARSEGEAGPDQDG